MVDPVVCEGEDELREGPESSGNAEDGEQTVPDYQWSSQLKCRSANIITFMGPFLGGVTKPGTPPQGCRRYMVIAIVIRHHG